MNALTADQYNLLLARASQNQPLRGTRNAGSGPGPHCWRVTAQRISAKKQNEWGINPLDGTQYFSAAIFQRGGGQVAKPGWRIYIGAGTVNDRVAAITYRKTSDPRGWKMPENYPALDASQTVDRLLTERLDPPHLLLTGPGDDGKSGGDFERVPDALRARHPEVFRTREAWERELWTAVVYVTAEPLSASLAWDRLGFPVPQRTGRYRVAARSRMPSFPPGTQHGGAHQLATLYLLRDAATGESQLSIEQRTFWPLWTSAADINPLSGLNPFLGPAPSFGGIGAGLADAFATGTFEVIDAITGGALQSIADSYAAASTVQFWTV